MNKEEFLQKNKEGQAIRKGKFSFQLGSPDANLSGGISRKMVIEIIVAIVAFLAIAISLRSFVGGNPAQGGLVPVGHHDHMHPYTGE